MIGSGTAPEPRGIRNIVGIQAVTNGVNGASLATTRYANLLSATQSILTVNGFMPTAAIMAPRTLVGFGSLADTTNQPLQRPDMLKNLQMVATSQLPVNLTVGSSTDCSEIFVGDFTRTLFAMRKRSAFSGSTKRSRRMVKLASWLTCARTSWRSTRPRWRW